MLLILLPIVIRVQEKAIGESLSPIRQLLPPSLIFIFFQFINPVQAMANGCVCQYVEVSGSEAYWQWKVNNEQHVLAELEIYDNTSDQQINRDGFDNAGFVRLDGAFFQPVGDVNFVNGSTTFSGDIAMLNTSATWQFQENWWQISVNTLDPTPIRIELNLGSDSGTRWVEINGKLYSYQRGNDEGTGEIVYEDPIFYWVDVPTTFGNGSDVVYFETTGTSLTTKLHSYAHRWDNANIDNVSYMEKFAQFVNEDVNRTDIFDYTTWSPAPAPAPAPVFVRKTTDLSFSESISGTDYLSDPDGELRKTVDQIMANYGSLIR